MNAGDDGTAELAAELGAAVAARLIALEGRVAELERERRRPPLVRLGGPTTLLDHAD
ncbi:hypothetical protein [Mycolicibacter algericus]|uniref:Uncharacterized protein n=1 Tax=Mycolicibacter algericus TaxID=1288388 RepID=A0A7I9Y7B4_MYCAL|nr:hypothetical protein [Mycolicibacter algericus]GFG84575.1 hypothetical protein MALGJ_12510 [Mycolicibacter algericus]